MPRLAISFSGGRTSAVMTKMLWDRYSTNPFYDVSICFANTGQEHPATLDFVHACEFEFGWPVVWLEAVVTQGKRVGIRHKKVDYFSADRMGTPFREYIEKYGIPNAAYKQCTSRLKEEVMDSYRHRELGWKEGSYDTAIGIRADELSRVSSKFEEKRFVYPLLDKGWGKLDVQAEINKWPFDLQLPSDAYGNCVWCWKKSKRKLQTVAKRNPEWFSFPAAMERLHGMGANKKRPDIKRDVMFRGFQSAEEIVREAQTADFVPYSDSEWWPFDDELDVGGACGESCEIGADE